MHCSIYHFYKQVKLPYSEKGIRSKNLFDLVHLNVWGRYQTLTHQNKYFFLTIVEDHSRTTWVYLMTHKSEVTDIIIRYHKMIQTQFDQQIKIFRSDNGTEFTCSSLQKNFSENEILHQTSFPTHPNKMGW